MFYFFDVPMLTRHLLGGGALDAPTFLARYNSGLVWRSRTKLWVPVGNLSGCLVSKFWRFFFDDAQIYTG